MALFTIQGSVLAAHGCNFPPSDCRVGVGFKTLDLLLWWVSFLAAVLPWAHPS